MASLGKDVDAGFAVAEVSYICHCYLSILPQIATIFKSKYSQSSSIESLFLSLSRCFCADTRNLPRDICARSPASPVSLSLSLSAPPHVLYFGATSALQKWGTMLWGNRVTSERETSRYSVTRLELSKEGTLKSPT